MLKDYFNISQDKENTTDTIETISKGVVFRGANLWILIFAIFTASLGLNVNSTAVIIGAMLISPLMGPIIGMGLAVGINDFDLMKRSIKNYLVATGISVLTATVYFLITPFDEVQSELLARTSPTLYDVLIALCGGAAGIVALSTKGKGNVLPGVAIATALMPPLCTAGFGVATGHWMYFLGAFYLFFINTVFISVATFVGVRLMKFPRKVFVDRAREKKVHRSLVAIVVVTMLPSFFMTYNILRTSLFKRNIDKFVKTELKWNGVQILASESDYKNKTLTVVAIGREVPDDSIKLARKQLVFYNLEDLNFQIIQGSQTDSVQLHNFTALQQGQTNLLKEQSQQIHQLEDKLGLYTQYEQMGGELSRELKALYPEVTSLGLCKVVENETDSVGKSHAYVVALMKQKKNIDAIRRERLYLWLKTRVKADSLQIILQLK